jgi:Family of unknown function (DUF6788)
MTTEEKRIVQIKEKLFNLGPVLPGSLSQQWNVCGSAGCKGKNPKHPVKHGPYYQLSYTLKGKSSTVFVKKAVLKEVYARIKRHKEFRARCDALVEAYIAAFRQHGLEGK